MGALHPDPKFICLYQFSVIEQRKDLHLRNIRFTLESSFVDLNHKHSYSDDVHFMALFVKCP